MTERYPEFMVNVTGKSPRNLKNSIRRVLDASAGFGRSWLAGEEPEAYETSQEAFGHLDYITSELLRQRDMQSGNTTTWPASPLKAALTAPVGLIIDNVAAADEGWFRTLPAGSGSLPAKATTATLTLGKALNKLKHRDLVAFNFSFLAVGGHTLYMITKAGMGQPCSLSSFSVLTFCNACKGAALHV